jgi:hypothetical protein
MARDHLHAVLYSITSKGSITEPVTFRYLSKSLQQKHGSTFNAHFCTHVGLDNTLRWWIQSQLPTFKPQCRLEGKKTAMVRGKSKISQVYLIRAKRVPESARLGNALDTTRHASIVEVLGVFMLYFALHQVMYGARSYSSIAGYRSFRNGRSAAARLMGLMQPEPGPITPRVLLEVAIGNQKPCHQHSRFLPVPRASAVKFLRWRFSDQSSRQS